MLVAQVLFDNYTQNNAPTDINLRFEINLLPPRPRLGLTSGDLHHQSPGFGQQPHRRGTFAHFLAGQPTGPYFEGVGERLPKGRAGAKVLGVRHAADADKIGHLRR